MAVVDVHSTELQNTEASPIIANDIRNIHGRLRIKSAQVTVANADTNLSTYRMFRVRSGDSIKSLQLRNNANFTGATGWDCGLYTINGGAEVDLDLYGDAQILAVAVPAVPHLLADSPYLECRFGDATTSVLTDINNRVFEDLGLTTDPQIEYDVVMTGSVIGTVGGVISLTMLYTAGD
jgi:hypothetical protein